MDTFSVLADATRRNIVELLAKNGQLSAADISDKFKVTPSAISQHLKVLREARFVQMERKAQKRIYKINTNSLLELEEWVSKIKSMWEGNFERLDKLLAKQNRY